MEEPNTSFWQTTYSPNGKWLSMLVDRGQSATVAVMAAEGSPESTWRWIARDHGWIDKPRWSPDGRRLYFLSKKGSSSWNVWGIQFDPDRGVPVGDPFRISYFDSPAFGISPRLTYIELSASNSEIVTTMKAASGNIWMLDNVDR